MAAKRVFVLGGGAIGTIVAHQMRAVGHEITVLLRRKPALLEHARASPQSFERATIALEEPLRNTTTSQTVDIEYSDGTGDLIRQLVVTTKAQDISPALRLLQNRLTDDTGIVLIHNGLLTESLATLTPAVRPGNITIGVWQGGSLSLAPLPSAHTVWTAPSVLQLGNPIAGYERSKDAQSLLQILTDCKSLRAEVVTSENLYLIQRQKLAINCAINPLTALLQVKNGILAEATQVNTIITHVCNEIAAVYEGECEALGMRHPEQLGAKELKKSVQTAITVTAANSSSTLQDVRKDKPTEILHINGAISALGQRYGVATPYNELLTQLVLARSSEAISQGRVAI